MRLAASHRSLDFLSQTDDVLSVRSIYWHMRTSVCRLHVLSCFRFRTTTFQLVYKMDLQNSGTELCSMPVLSVYKCYQVTVQDVVLKSKAHVLISFVRRNIKWLRLNLLQRFTKQPFLLHIYILSLVFLFWLPFTPWVLNECWTKRKQENILLTMPLFIRPEPNWGAKLMTWLWSRPHWPDWTLMSGFNLTWNSE